MRICFTCQVEKPLDHYYPLIEKGRPLRWNSSCKKCFNAYCIRRWKQIKIDEVAAAGGGCSVCGYNRCMSALEFHHLDPSIKEYNWSKLRAFSKKRRKAELSKCILLCSNCHKEEHEKLHVALSC
jgi:hypothetical protein